MMRPLAHWPSWLLKLARPVLALLPYAHGAALTVALELWERERPRLPRGAYAVAPIRGVQ